MQKLPHWVPGQQARLATDVSDSSASKDAPKASTCSSSDAKMHGKTRRRHNMYFICKIEMKWMKEINNKNYNEKNINTRKNKQFKSMLET